MSGKILRELQPDYLIQSSKLLSDVTACDSVWGRRLLLSALAVLDPNDPLVRSAFPTMRRWVIDNDTKFSKMTADEVVSNDDAINQAALVRYFDLAPDCRTFAFSYRNFIKFWENSDDPKLYHKTIRNSAEKALGMKYAQAYEILKGEKVRVVNRYLNVFSMIEIDGFETVTIKLVADFMPFLIFLSREFKKNGYSSFPVQCVVGKRSVAALIMSQLALRFFKINKGVSQSFKFEIQNLRLLTGCEDSYLDPSHFRRRIIEKGIAEINADFLGGFKMEINHKKTIKRGKKITHLTFIITSEMLNRRVLKTPEQISNRHLGSPAVISDHSFCNAAPTTKENPAPAKERKPLPGQNKIVGRGKKTKEELLAQFDATMNSKKIT